MKLLTLLALFGLIALAVSQTHRAVNFAPAVKESSPSLVEPAIGDEVVVDDGPKLSIRKRQSGSSGGGHCC